MKESSRRANRPIPFLLHQVFEYLGAALLIAYSVHLAGRSEAELIATGGALVVLNAVTEAPLGAFGALGLRAHRLVDSLIAVLLALSPLIGLFHGGIQSIFLAEVVAFVLLSLARSTRYERSSRAPMALSQNEVRDSAAAAAALGAAAVPVAGRLVRRSARTLGVAAGLARRQVRNRKSLRSSPED